MDTAEKEEVNNTKAYAANSKIFPQILERFYVSKVKVKLSL
jgi:hypothetical protein